MVFDNPARRLLRTMQRLDEAREEAEALLDLTQGTPHLNLQKEAAWIIHHLNQLIAKGHELLPDAGRPGKGKAPRTKRGWSRSNTLRRINYEMDALFNSCLSTLHLYGLMEGEFLVRQMRIAHHGILA